MIITLSETFSLGPQWFPTQSPEAKEIPQAGGNRISNVRYHHFHVKKTTFLCDILVAFLCCSRAKTAYSIVKRPCFMVRTRCLMVKPTVLNVSTCIFRWLNMPFFVCYTVLFAAGWRCRFTGGIEADGGGQRNMRYGRDGDMIIGLGYPLVI